MAEVYENSSFGCCKYSVRTPPSRPKISHQQLNTNVNPERPNHSRKPPVAPKPSHLRTSESCSSEMLPKAPGHQEIPLASLQQNNPDTCSAQIHAGNHCVDIKAMQSPRVPVLPVPHPHFQTSKASPPKLPRRTGSTSSPGIHHNTNTTTVNEKRPSIPPKPKTTPHHSVTMCDDPKVLPSESECSLRLIELADNYSNSFPVQVKVVQGFYGQTSSQTVNSNDTYNIVCPKLEEVLIIRDENQHHYSVPLSSAIQFSLLYIPDGMKEAMKGRTFKKVANIVALENPPKVICATKSCSGIKRNEVLVIQSVHKQGMKGKKTLEVFSLLTRSKKTLPHDCSGDFSTDPSLIRMYPADIHASLQYLNRTLFPCDAKLYFNSEVADQLLTLPMPGHLTGVITVCELNTRRSLVAYQVLSEDHDGENPPIFDIPLDENLSNVEIIVAYSDLKNESQEGRMTSSMVSILKSVSFNPSKLQPWEPKQSDATKTLLRKYIRKGYENVGIRLEINPQWAHSANAKDLIHELMEADAAADRRCGYDTIAFYNVHSDIPTSDASETDTDSLSHESNDCDSDCPKLPPRTSSCSRSKSLTHKVTPKLHCDSDRPKLPPRTSSCSRSRSLTHKVTPKLHQTEECTLPVQNKSQMGGVSPSLRPFKEQQPSDPLKAAADIGGCTSPLPMEAERATHTTNQTESDCTSPELFPVRNETSKSKSHPPKQELRVDLPLQQLQEQMQSLQKQVSLLMVSRKDDEEPTDPTPASGDIKLQNSDLKYIMQTLSDLSAWYLLGVYLDVPKGKLDQFHATYGGGPDAIERCKIETVCYWLENARKPTWEKLAAAVHTMGRRGIVEKISNRCGVRLLMSEAREHHETVLEVSPEQVSEIEPLQKEMKLKDQEFYLVEQKQGQLDEQLRNLQKELSNVRDWLQFNERLTRKLISDGQRIKSDLTRAAVSHKSNQVRNQSLAMQHKSDRISSLCKQQEQSKSKLEEALKERRELKEKLHDLESKILTASQGLHQLQSQQQSARAALHRQEQAINERLVSSTEHQYYNIVILDGKVEMRLTQQQVETLHRKVSDENRKVKQLHEQLQFHQQKLQDITRQNELLDRKGQTVVELEKHQRAYLESTLEADVMQCQIEISATEFHKQEMENRLRLLQSHMKNIRRRQGQYEKIKFEQKGAQQTTFKIQGGTHPDSPRAQPYSSSQRPPQKRKPLQYENSYREEVDRPSTIVHQFRRSRSTHPAKAIRAVGCRAMPISSIGEQHRPFNPTTTPFIPRTHAPLFRNRSSHDFHHRPHPQLQRVSSAFPYFSNPPFKAVHRSAEEEYVGQPDEGYVIETFEEMGADENDSMLNGGMYEPMQSYSSHEYKSYSSHEYDDFSQEAEYFPSNNSDSDSIEEVDECYTETEFTQPSNHDLAHQMPNRPPRPSKNKYI